jgi:hypothetical protein
MPVVRIAAALAVAAAVAACVSAGSGGPALTPIASLTDTLPVQPPMIGSFQSVLNAAAGVAVAGRGPRVDGTVTLTPSRLSSDRFGVDMDFTSDRGSETLLWGVVSGRCGSGDLPLVSPRDLAPVVVTNNGSARLHAEFRAPLTAGQDYHVNLYANDGTQLADVVACANLK